MAETPNFLFYKSWYDIVIEQIPEREKQNELFRAIIEHGITGESELPFEIMFLKQAYAQIDSAKDKHQKRVEAGRKGGKAGKGVSRNKGNQNARRKNNSKTKPNENENDNVNTNDSLSFVIINNNPSGPLPDGSPSDYRERLEDELGDEYE